jgi:hypothetical protein
MKALRTTLAIGHSLVGIGALAGGLGAVLNPAAPMGMPASALRLGPFRDFLVPGLFLMIVLGAGNLGAGAIAARKCRYYGITSGAMGATMLAWIAIQCWILQDVVALHVIFFIIGAIQGLLAFAACWEADIFPARFLRKWFGTGGQSEAW